MLELDKWWFGSRTKFDDEEDMVFPGFEDGEISLGAHEVIQLDWRTRKILRRWPAPSEPRRVALSRDGRCLVAVSVMTGISSSCGESPPWKYAFAPP